MHQHMKDDNKKNPAPKRESKPAKPVLPQVTLESFLQDRITLKGAATVKNVHAGFLWRDGGVERYRINVWASEPIEQGLYSRDFIAASFFVHYQREGDRIVDKTIEINSENSRFLT